ncbi:MAG: alternate F1F0 ATPase, F1 subunit alpha [Bacteroidetes bacterium]|nr:alternate F1F0 ATPase, F1 subunit alpha [Bacteroidota bacterium]
MTENNLDHVIGDLFDKMGRLRDSGVPSLELHEVGTILSISSGIVRVSGLPGAGSDELLKFPGDLYGIAFSLEENEIGVILLGDETKLSVGDEVQRTFRVMDVPVGESLLGRVVDPLGFPLDEKGPVPYEERLPVERDAPEIMDRAPVREPLQTGIKVIDALIPIGRGQRELILGDRQTGKTSIAIDAIINQKDKNVVCIYCAIGQRMSSVAKSVTRLHEKGAMAHTIVIVTEGNNSPGLSYLAPYAATSMAEYFMEKGRDVLVVYDDLTNHARAYRELSLLLRRPPGREAFPGDIFYIHSRLLERATHLNEKDGGGSLTALPIVETEAQNISAYIPTNLISITDGQLYLSPKLFELGVLPAIDIGKSVSRVGGKAQLPAYRTVAGSLKLSYAQFEELETFSRFGAKLDERTQKIIRHGRAIRECFKQNEMSPLSVSEQMLVLLSLNNGLLDTIPLSKIREAENALCMATQQIPADLLKRLLSDQSLMEPDSNRLLEIASEALRTFTYSEQNTTEPTS